LTSGCTSMHRTLSVHSIARPISFVAEESNCLTLLTEFLRRGSHILMEIVDETDRVADLQKLARKRKGGSKQDRKTPSQKESSDE